MKLNHINLGVTDVQATAHLFEHYFGLKRADMPFNSHMAFSYDDNGSLISVFRATDVHYPGIFHVGFLQDTVQEVWALHEQLRNGGFQPQEPREEHGRLVFYFDAPGGFTVEVSTVL